MDKTGNGAFLAEVAMQRYGAARIQQVHLSAEWYRDNMPPFKAALEDGELVGLPRDEDILADLRCLRVVNGVARVPEGRGRGADGGKRHGDAAVATALAHFASRGERLSTDATPLGRPRVGMGLTDFLGGW